MWATQPAGSGVSFAMSFITKINWALVFVGVTCYHHQKKSQTNSKSTLVLILIDGMHLRRWQRAAAINLETGILSESKK